MNFKGFAKFTTIAALSALPLSLFGASEALADPVRFTLVNKTSRPLEAFYVVPPNEQTWLNDLLEGKKLPPGYEVELIIDDGRTDCLYDVKGILGPGAGVGRGELIQTDVNICDGAIYEYTE